MMADTDRNLLFGVLAMQQDLIDPRQFADACALWAVRKNISLADLLLERGWITEQDRRDVERFLERKLKRHGGDIRATLGAAADANVRDAIRGVDDSTLRNSIAALPPAAGYVLVETLVRPTAQRSRYQLTRLHAEGGLGKVWLARDSDLNRDVALKEIQPSQVSQPEAWRRFVQEAQVTGQLEHPNIVPVYELSRRPEDDQPFYTMRFVRGQTLRDAIADFHREGSERRGDPLERLRLLQAFVSICQAVGYAHSRGVIHRDLKPENVVLGGFGEVILLDWGLAKMVDAPDPEQGLPGVAVTADARVDATIPGRQLGTPAYMAPEQAEGRLDLIDNRTDIYGLGAILFETLAGRPPHSGKDATEVLQRIVSGDTPGVRSVEPSAPKALDAVCARAMNKLRSGRYAKASDLADDVQRWLAYEPVSAYPEPWTTRLARQARKHKTLVTAAAVLLLTSIPILTVSSIRIAREQEQTAKNFMRACDAVNTMLTEVGEVDLADVPQMEAKRKKLLDQARGFYLKVFRETPPSSSAVRLEAGRANGRLGDIAEMLGDYIEAEQAYDQANTELERLVAAHPADVSYRSELARSKYGQGVLMKKSNRSRESEAAFREALALWEKVGKDAPQRTDVKGWVNKTQYQLGALLAKLEGRSRENESLYDAALKSQEELLVGNPDSEQLANYARQLNNLAILMAATGRRAEAESRYRRAAEILEKLTAEAPTVPGHRYRLAYTDNNLALLLLGSNPREAERLFRKAHDLLNALANDFPKVPDYQQDLARSSKNLGDLLAATQDGSGDQAPALRAASTLLTRALERQRGLAAASPAIANYRASLASTLTSQGNLQFKTDPREAMKSYQEAIDTHEQLVKEFPNVPEYRYALGESVLSLARSMATQNDPGTCPQIERAIAAHRAALEADPRNVRYALGLCEDERILATVLLALGQHAPASEAAFALARIRPSNFEDKLEAARIFAVCALVVRQGTLPDEEREAAATNYARKAVDQLRSAFGPGSTLAPRALDDSQFEPLRQDDVFKQFREELDQKTKPAAGPASPQGNRPSELANVGPRRSEPDAVLNERLEGEGTGSRHGRHQSEPQVRSPSKLDIEAVRQVDNVGGPRDVGDAEAAVVQGSRHVRLEDRHDGRDPTAQLAVAVREVADTEVIVEDRHVVRADRYVDRREPLKEELVGGLDEPDIGLDGRVMKAPRGVRRAGEGRRTGRCRDESTGR